MIALIDADGLTYSVCYNREKQNAIVNLDDEGLAIFTPEEEEQYKADIFQNFCRELSEVSENVFAQEARIVLRGNNNFRYEVDPYYKKNRSSNGIKVYADYIKDRALKLGMAIASDGCESDDIIRMWAEELRAEDKDFVVCTTDKDLKMIPGKHYHLKTKQIITVSEHEAWMSYHQQLLMGDSVDSIPGIWKMGPVKSSKALKDCDTLESFQDVVIDQYIKAYGDQWREELELTGKLVHLWRWENDFFSLDEWPAAKDLVV
jgi:5'-3' exonuclease